MLCACLLALFVGISAQLSPFSPDDPFDCITSESPCQWERTCARGVYQSKQLTIPIPLQYDDIAHISCCFKCTIQQFEPRSAFLTDPALMSKLSSVKNLVDPRGSKIALMSKSHLLRISHHIIMNSSLRFGTPTQYAITSVSSLDAHDWMDIQGRSLIFVNTNPTCTPSNIVQPTLQRIEHANNPFIRAYYSYQLPCQTPMNVEPWYEKINLLPVGIRSPIAMATTFSRLDTPAILLDCTCARGSRLWDQLKGATSLPCSFGRYSTAGIDTSETVADVDNFVEVYHSMSSAKYVLSPSRPEEMSPCEWEALALGAIPIVSSDLFALAKIRKLFQGLPIYFANFSTLTKESLANDYEGLRRKHADPAHFSLSKIYFPFWLHELTQHMLTGKPPQRVWEKIDTLVSDRKSGIKDCGSLDRRNPLTFSNFGHIGAALTSHRGLSARTRHTPPGATKRRKDLKLEFVLPRCCEDGNVEFAWVEQLLSVTALDTGVSIYYKCPSCLPLSRSSEWLNPKTSPFISSDFGQSRGVTLIDDSRLLDVGRGRVVQKTCIDRVHNGKEVTAYLSHIIDNYDHLADQTVFLTLSSPFRTLLPPRCVVGTVSESVAGCIVTASSTQSQTSDHIKRF
jgi:hypothetical protein